MREYPKKNHEVETCFSNVRSSSEDITGYFINESNLQGCPHIKLEVCDKAIVAI
jgi:hypothetical protein